MEMKTVKIKVVLYKFFLNFRMASQNVFTTDRESESAEKI